MLEKILNLVFGTKPERDRKKLQPYADRINSLEPIFKNMTPEEMLSKTWEFKSRIEKGESLDSILPEAFALVREASVRTLGMRHFDVQLMGGVVLHKGQIAEMKTGEGKTLVATLPVYLNALTGKGVHVVTVNDYLARRDAEWMGPIYKYLGLTVGVIQHNMGHIERQKAYAADITYGTNNEFGFDYLRDNMVEHKSLRVQRGLNYCIVDEVDSILIDEARTPLIISGSVEESTKKYILINKIIPQLKEGVDYEVNEKEKNAILTEAGVAHVEKILKIDNLYDNKHIDIIHHIHQALKAHTVFHRDVDYIVKDGEVIIVDEFTGRLMPGRRFSDGLHQALEAKENVTVARESQTLASITFQNYFRMYNKLAGMTGTAETESVEFKKIYGLDVAVIPTNLPLIRKDHPDRVYRTEREKFNAIVNEIVEYSQKGRPVLVGTISIEKSEKLSQLLKSRGIIHNVLNAKYHEKEAQIIAEAGRPGTVTIATNMAGRGTDIVLGGKRSYIDDVDNHRPVHDLKLWEDFRYKIINSEFDEAEKLIEQMQGQDKNKALAIVKNGREWIKNHNIVVEAGGLHILGTERHESRRIDNQLRGRSGRQGDPGSSRFYLSLEDDLMRLFGSDRISRVMDRLGMEEGQEIESPMVSKAIATAQKRVEGRNFEIRKHLLEYDDVMNAQRTFIYKERNEILDGADLSVKISGYFAEVLSERIEYFTLGERHPDQWDLEGLKLWLKQKFLFDINYDEINPFELSFDEFKDLIIENLLLKYKEKEERIGTEDIRILERLISLQVIDNKWREHLLAMDHLRDGIWTMGYGERNPLVEYKIEGSRIFSNMLLNMKEEIIEYMMKVEVRKVEVDDTPQNDIPFKNAEVFHPEVDQFGTGGIPAGLSLKAKNTTEEKSTEGGVKRKKTRRSRR
ncbi:MAG TPA: preprotein translocase subunit SecA [Spirochaetota bacterium]|jgi:preprotein translocase subunit SecA|nr:preprotein translocase subunit SecA [Spirochaetota bacterium]OQB00560.1 MAG: preprotein translocase subunit SecA [Spirochaetes bacterium ADurb.Bin218]HOK91401.1 preprotein translocase subunit SecA [Spirochaetota bacterium]HOQ12638.1 preprotein translocase subunit SecA [Spirochaetota bacterium]HOV08040.1 preprotein translocase subunit SecA [Spirochaetota bacterium]